MLQNLRGVNTHPHRLHMQPAEEVSVDENSSRNKLPNCMSFMTMVTYECNTEQVLQHVLVHMAITNYALKS